MLRSLAILVFVCSVFNGFAQSKHNSYIQGLKHLDHIVDLIRKDKVKSLANLVSYPLSRSNPIPDIKNKKEFIAWYPVMFDSAFKNKLLSTHFDESNSWDNYRGFCLFQGDMWLDDAGKIIAVNHESPQELALIARLTNETQAKMPGSIKPWKRNVMVCETDKYLVRIDQMEDDDIRYICWNKPKTIANEPDLVLFYGRQDFQGTMGGVTYTFRNEDWTYVVARVDMAENNADLGVFLYIFHGDIEKAKYRCKAIK